MKMKKILSGVLAAAMTVTAVTVTSWTLSAADDDIPKTSSEINAPEGKETVIAAFKLTDDKGNNAKKEYTSKWEDGAYISLSDTAAYMDETDVYVKVSTTNVGTAGDNNDPLETIVTWSGYETWAPLMQFICQDSSTPFKILFVPTKESTSESAVAYAPISAFSLTNWGGIGGTIQSGNFSKVTLESVELVRVEEEVFDDDPGTETLFKDKDVTWNRQCQGGYWDGDKSLDLSSISFENLGDFVQNGEIIAEWESVKVTKADDNTDITENCQFTIKINCNDTDGKPCYDGIGAYGAKGLTYKTLKLDSKSIVNYAEGKADYTDVAFTYGAEPAGDYSAEKGDKIKVTITGLTIKATTKKDIPATAIKLSSAEESLYVDETVTLKATVTPSGATNKDKMKWQSDKEEVATVDQNGVVTAKGVGNATITVTITSEVTASCEITVSARPVSSVTLTPTTLPLKKGETATLTATVLPTNATDKTVTWTIDGDNKVATIKGNADGTCEVTAVGKGEATITATAGGKTATCAVTVTVPAESVTLDQTTLPLFTGKSATLTATVTPDDTTDTVEWSSGDPTVATIEEKADGTCEVTAVGAGTAVITATAGEAEAAKCTVTVKDPAKEIILDDISIVIGEEQDITYTTDPAKATLSNIEYATGDPTVFTVTDGKVKGVGAGSATLTMTATNEVGTKLEKTCTVTVSAEAIAATAITLLPDTAIELEVEGTKILTATLTPADSTDKITWTSSDETVASVDKTTGATVTVTALKEGTATITAAANETVKATCTVTVTAKTIVVESVTLTPTAATVEEGKTVELTATVNPDNAADKTVTWTTSDPAVATVENGVVTAVKEGTATITATAGTKSATCKITVTKKVIAIESVTLDKETATVEEGETVELTATVMPSDATDKTVTWSSSDDKIATVENGKVTAVKAGEATITATAGGKSAECKITVTAKKADDPKPDDPKPDDPKPDDPKPDDPKPDEDNINISFVDEPYELKVVDATSWSGGEYTKAAQVNIELQISGITYGTTTFGEIKNKTITLNNIVYKSCGIEGVKASDIEVCIYMLHGKDAWEWVGSEAGSMEDTTITWDLSTLAAARAVIPDSSPIQAIGYQINIKGSDVEAIEAMEVGETVKVNGNSGDNESDALWEGSAAQGTAWAWNPAEVAAAKFTAKDAAAGDKITIKFTIDNDASYHQLKIMDGTADHNVLTSIEVNEWGVVEVNEETFSFVLNEADAETLKADGMTVIGYDVTIKLITLEKAATPAPDETTSEEPTPAPSVPEGSFTVPTTSGSSSGDNTAETTTAAPAPAESEQAAPSSTEEDTSTNTTSPLATKDGGDDVQPTESGTPVPDGGNGDAGSEDSADVGNAGAGNAGDKNAATGVTLALIPMIAAAAGVVISKKRK